MKAIFGLFASRAIFHEFLVHFSWKFEFSLKKSRLIARQEINFIFVFDALKMKISASTYFLEYWSYSNARQPGPARINLAVNFSISLSIQYWVEEALSQLNSIQRWSRRRGRSYPKTWLDCTVKINRIHICFYLICCCCCCCHAIDIK